MFNAVLGNAPVKAYLKKAIEENRLPQTLLFTGPDGVGKRSLARALASHLLGTTKETDLHILAPEGKSGLYTIDSIRQMIDKDHSAPFESSGKVFILEDADRMMPSSANALLKTLEEPSPDSTFILLTSRISDLLPTVLSRCSQITFQPLKTSEVETILHDKGLPIHFAKLALGSVGRAVELATQRELETHREILFRILAEKPSYPDLVLELTKLDVLVEKVKEENPVHYNTLVDHLFASILMWHRDQHLRSLGGDPSLLFFPDSAKSPPISLREVEKAIEKARLAFSRNMKLSQCLLQACDFSK